MHSLAFLPQALQERAVTIQGVPVITTERSLKAYSPAVSGKAARSPRETDFCLRAAGFTGVCNEVARAKKIFSGTGSLQASHRCSAHTV
ncbi:hypothetical protein Dthio_PD1493 [Desulfonatronospira thiodismutans ASO3-1]|uniref:Uncharacterized protein n=1 Tax=Desulfonatronospira thiodismutans ASO3-1 TaxID=555779 RepID=D6STY5_9BACT|nr:hypothetical protein Dthio_PD1493 [Desulfonatronospira thiodismutans ASO3-1]